jgi:RNA polymerase primary sigma factor
MSYISGGCSSLDSLIDNERAEEKNSKNCLENTAADFLCLVNKSLNKREREIIRLRYGLAGGKAYTLSQIGKKYNLSKEGVRLIQKRAIKKLKKVSGLENFLDN